MNIVFYLSQPLDFQPVYEKKVPLELVSFQGLSLYEKLYRDMLEYFPDAEYFVIDQGIVPSFHDIIGTADVLNIPSANLLVRILLFSTFAAAGGISPLALFIPANCIIEKLDNFSMTVRNSINNFISGSLLTFISSSNGPYPHNIEKAEPLEKKEGYLLSGIKHIVTEHAAFKWMEDNKDKEYYQKFAGGDKIFLLNSLKIPEILNCMNPDLYTLYQYLADSWPDGRSINTILKDAIDALSPYSFEEFLKNTEEKFSASADFNYHEINSMPEWLNEQSLDDNGNYIIGGVELNEVRQSLIVNHSRKSLVLTKMRDVMALANDKAVRITGI